MNLVSGFLKEMRHRLCGIPYLEVSWDSANIRPLGFINKITTDELELALRKSDSYRHVTLGFAYHGYGSISGCTPGHEAVISRIFRERIKPLESLYLMQNGISEQGMKSIIDSLDKNFAKLHLTQLTITHESVHSSTKEALLQLMKKHSGLRIFIREFGTQRDSGTGAGYTEELY